jgi:hypothetical protein
MSGQVFNFTLLYPFLTVPRASGPVFMICDPGLAFGSKDVAGSSFHFLRFQSHFQRYRRRQVRFSWFALSDEFSAVTRSSGPVFIFALPDSFSVVSRA